jgi:hypothetical protein
MFGHNTRVLKTSISFYMMQGHMKKSLKKVFNIGCAAFIAGGVYSAVGKAIVDNFYPTPEDIIKKYNLKLSPKAHEILQEHKDVRMIEGNSTYQKAFDILFPLISYFHLDPLRDTHGQFYQGNDGIWPLKPIILMEPFSNDYAQKMTLAYSTRYSSDPIKKINPDITNEMVFLHTLFHELGHHKNCMGSKDRDGYLESSDTQTRETFADLYSADSLSDDFGDKLRTYIISSRSLIFTDPDHYTVAGFLENKSYKDYQLGMTAPQYSKTLEDYMTKASEGFKAYDASKSGYSSARMFTHQDEQSALPKEFNTAAGFAHKYMGYLQWKKFEPSQNIPHIARTMSEAEVTNQYYKAYKYFYPESYTKLNYSN